MLKNIKIVPTDNDQDGLWLEEETLSDGSHAYNVVIAKMEFLAEDKEKAERLYGELAKLMVHHDAQRVI